jgi:hypothetical protein
MIIDSGDVRETARIKINHSDIGLLRCIPDKTKTCGILIVK